MIVSVLHLPQCCHFGLFKTKSGLFCNRLIYFFTIWFIVYFFIFWFVFVFLKMFYARYQLCSLQYCVKENLSKLLESLLFLATVCSNISLCQQEQILYIL